MPILCFYAHSILYHWSTCLNVIKNKTDTYMNCSKRTLTRWNFTRVMIILHKRCLWCLWQISCLPVLEYICLTNPPFFTRIYLLAKYLHKKHLFDQIFLPEYICLTTQLKVLGYLNYCSSDMCKNYNHVYSLTVFTDFIAAKILFLYIQQCMLFSDRGEPAAW